MLSYCEDINFLILFVKFISPNISLRNTINIEQSYLLESDSHLVLIRLVYDWVEDAILSKISSQSLLYFIHDYLNMLIIPFISFYLLFVVLLGVCIGGRSIVSNRLLIAVVAIAEQEFATPKVITLVLSIILCTILGITSLLAFSVNLTGLRALYLISASFLCYFVVFIPFSLIYNWGAYFLIYIKGQSIKKNILFELLTDCMHLISFFLRINIQLIRLVIITCLFYIYNEMYVEVIYPTFNTSFTYFGALNYIYVGAAFFLKLIASLLYEITHLWVMVGMQSGAFVVIIFIITQFLYSVYLAYRLQPFLINLRLKKKVN